MGATVIRELRQHSAVWRGISEVPPDWPACAVTIGVFDGVHRGHAWLIESTLRTARETGLPTVLVTFDPHPARVLGLPRDTSALSSVARRADLVRELGVDRVCVLPFTHHLARMSPEEFVERVLVDALHAAAVVVGANFTFGHRGTGDVEDLRCLGVRHGFTAHCVHLLPTGESRCSSTHIRDCLRRGDLQAATRALGRPHEVEGVLAPGHQIIIAPGAALPPPGRYAGLIAQHAVELRVTRSAEDGSEALHLESPAAPLAPHETVLVQFLDRVPSAC
ncbi:cytidyltransferase [Saccharopolyspora mangrovi]|uniref:FAD synthase n=1 Tax=Saccharopolyspora mangrovi TaxID=3082379 RepID=A0ABU6AE21_9PSEU|nr:cytidyltransferase [Saccharopolyspora sp. S2-29]MEB3369723.1 cytidyltransferase [Saccharopolyspora sp. S2-29]